ncbi:MAG: glycogen/starch/alpha-glucan phosphorylase [Firmicutes bacterium]|nr:glycogen/starch/alpha-glucan phosphorylase [Bacillota bacterium]
MFKNKYDFIEELTETARSVIGREFEECSPEEKYYALARLVAAEANDIRVSSAKKEKKGKKKVYYFSMEFLIGKLLENYLMNLDLTDMARDALSVMGENLEDYYALERDPGLGNGGLGRLAACFVDSLASLGYAACGQGIRYRFGLFQQRIEGGVQVEDPDNWLEGGYPWESRHPESAVVVRFGGTVERQYEEDGTRFLWKEGERILAMPYDVPIVGYGGETVNTLRLWSAEPCEENFDMDAFNRGDYAGAIKHRADVEAITSILYPNDNASPGKVLRLKQEYMFVCAGIADIVKTFKKDHGSDWARFPELVAIHTNDTHPSLCAPELLRVLIDEEGLNWDQAWDIVTRSISYTNHTILPEALEKWPIDTFRSLLPRVYDFVEEIDRRYRESFPKDFDHWQDLLKNTAILWDGQVRTANLSVIAGHSVNGVAALHTEILKNSVLKEFYTLTPEKFNNKTNGIAHRRFLAQANHTYRNLITETIGDGWMKDASQLAQLKEAVNDPEFLSRAYASKRSNKVNLARYIRQTTGITVDPDSIFDVQVKRFHGYKRQLLNIFKVMDLYNHILEDSNFVVHPSTFIFSGKAAQGYDFAKDVIRLINSVADVVNGDPNVRDRIKVVFVPNFSVSNAQLIYPAADISEQISTAGMEASGTGNMKFMMNGAITLGTLDGANVEIAEQVDMDNIKIFGLRSEEIDQFRRDGSYLSWDTYSSNPRLKNVVNQLVDGTYDRLSGSFHLIYDNLMRNNDEFFVLKDFNAYVDAWKELEALYSDKTAWGKISVTNTACSGFFSSDRTIEEYVSDIWHLDK